jgi:hypothetical protein
MAELFTESTTKEHTHDSTRPFHDVESFLRISSQSSTATRLAKDADFVAKGFDERLIKTARPRAYPPHS